MLKLYAGQVKTCNYFDSNVSALVQVYGVYDPKDPQKLQTLETPVLVNVRVGYKHTSRQILETTGNRLLLPAAGISAEAASKIENQRTGEKTGVHRLIGLRVPNIVLLNEQKLMDETYDEKVTTSKVMTGVKVAKLKEGVLSKLGKALKAFV